MPIGIALAGVSVAVWDPRAKNLSNENNAVISGGLMVVTYSILLEKEQI